MNREVCILPHFAPHEGGGVKRHIDALRRYLPDYGWEVSETPQPDGLVHAHANARAHVIDVYTSHGVYPFDTQIAWQKQINADIFTNLKLCREAIAVSYHTASFWAERTGITPHVITNGVALEEWENVPAGAWRQKLGLSPARPLVVWGKTALSATLDPIPAIKLALMRPDIFLVLTVDERWLPGLPDNARAIGPQPFESMQMLMQDMDALLAVTLENQPIQVLEAMALAKPVVGFRWGGTAETLQRGGGLLAEPGDIEGLAGALSIALEERELIGAQGRAVVERHYRWQDKVREVADVYERVLEARERERLGPKCSIVIPCHNKAPYIAETLVSTFMQERAPRYEVVIVDDASTDDSMKVIEQVLAEHRPGIDVTVQPLRENVGVAQARNIGVGLARGEYITCLDADDLIDPLWLVRLSAALDADPLCGIAYPDMTILQTDPQTHATRALSAGPGAEYDFARLVKGNYIPCANLFRRKAWERVGGYKDINPSWEDYELWLNMGAHDWYGRRVPAPLFYYRKVHKEGRDYEAQNYAWLCRARVNLHHRDLYPPLVSVVLPCYKQSAFLREALDSSLAQSFPDLEAVVVDDGNDEEEAAKIAQIVDEYPSDVVRLIRSEENRGLAEARNLGVREARGEWIVPLDADDVLDHSMIERSMHATGLNKRLFAYGDTLLWFPDDAARSRIVASEEYDFTALLKHVSFSCSIFYARTAWEEAGGYKDAMSKQGGWEDWEFAVHLGELGVCGVRVPHVFLHYRQHSPSQMRLKAERNLALLKETLRGLHAATYFGERPMSCCGRGTARGEPQAVPQAEPRASDGRVLVRYVGPRVGSSLYRGPSGRAYEFGLSTPIQSCYAEDAEYFGRLPDFQLVPAPSP